MMNLEEIDKRLIQLDYEKEDLIDKFREKLNYLDGEIKKLIKVKKDHGMYMPMVYELPEWWR